MATTAVSSTSSTSTAATTASSTSSTNAANRANAQKILTSLGAGSGVDVNSLAQNLVDAERVPRENAINQKITKNESRISGYSAITFMMTELKTALSDLKDKNSFNVATNTVSHPNALSVSAAANAELGSHVLKINSLAQPKMMMSGGFSSADQALDSAPLSQDWSNLTIAGMPIPVTTVTPQGIVDAINGVDNLGVKAKLVKNGVGANPYAIVLTGASSSDFSCTDSAAGAPPASSYFSVTQPASNATFTLDGVSYTRSSNEVSDVLTGVTLTLKAASASDNISLSLSRDTTSLKDKLNKVVTAYNDANNILNEVSNAKSTLDTYGATLVGDSTVRMIRQQLRGMLLGVSPTPGTNVSTLSQIGLSVDQAGIMTADATKMDKALTSNFDDVVQALTGGQNSLLPSSAVSGGIFGDAVKKITTLVSKSGPLLSQSENANTQNTRYKDDLAALQTRMDALLLRYTKQFSAMESLVGSVNAQKTSLKSSFDGMMAAYKN